MDKRQAFAVIIGCVLIFTGVTGDTTAGGHRLWFTIGTESTETGVPGRWNQSFAARILYGFSAGSRLECDVGPVVKASLDWHDGVSGGFIDDISGDLLLDVRYMIGRIGAAHLMFKGQTVIGAGLYADIWVNRSVGLGVQGRLPVGDYALNLWILAGLQEESAWTLHELDERFLQMGGALLPADRAGFAPCASITWTESGHRAPIPKWSGGLGYRFVF